MMAEWMKRYRVRSTLILVLSMWMMYTAARWGMWFAEGNGRNGMEIAAILAAVQAPATFLAGWAFKIYSENKIP